jgi:cytochrome c peroxidase
MQMTWLLCALIASQLALTTTALAKQPRPPAAGAEEQVFRLPQMQDPPDNPTTPAKVELGHALFFDPRLSGNGTVSCATCHNPALGWSDGLRTGIGINGTVLNRGTPTIVNTGFNTQFMWDGRKKSLEDQALGPMEATAEMSTDIDAAIRMLRSSSAYRRMFSQAFPGESIDTATLAKALAAFERSVVSKDSPFDRWLDGDRDAISMQEWRGYRVFVDPQRGNCAVCHSGGNFTDNGFHNLGIAKTEATRDDGRYHVRPIRSMRGAFKTPTLRDVATTPPYFHDGSAATLMDVVEHYNRGGDDRSNISPEIRPLNLSQQEKEDLVAFMQALSGRSTPVAIPALPLVDSPAAGMPPTQTAELME